MTLQHIDIVFQLIAFLFAISVHESSHAWMANLRGDPTAPVLGWAKPTPVDPRNFKNPVLDDILTSVVGPISNFAVATVAVLILVFVKLVSPTGREIVFGIPQGLISTDTNSFLMPLCLLVYELMVINIVLGVFNLIPVPPLDGSHVLRHLLPAGMLRIYDTVGTFGLLLLVFWGGGLLARLINPAVGFFNY